MAVKRTGAKQAAAGAGCWKPGQSGNPAGRPKGSRNKVTQLCADLLADDAGVLMAKLIGKAKRGDLVALKLCVERLVPVRAARDRYVDVEVPGVAKAGDLVAAAASIIESAAAGRMTIAEAREFMALLEVERKLIETTDLLVRVQAIEELQGGEPGPLDPERFEQTLAAEMALGVRVRKLECAE